MDEIVTLAGKTGALVVEDCALAVDATFDGRKAGKLGHTGCFSFYPVKHMTTIEGGMVTTNDDRLAALIAQKKAFGYDRTIDKRKTPGIYDVNVLGYNYRMSEVEAAVGLAQLTRLDEFQKRRADNFRRLQTALADVDAITVFKPRQGRALSSHYCLNIMLPRDGSISRDDMIRALTAAELGPACIIRVPCRCSAITARNMATSPANFRTPSGLQHRRFRCPLARIFPTMVRSGSRAR